MFDTVVVPVGFLSDVGPAILHGDTIARQAGAALELLTVRPSNVAEPDAYRHLTALANRHGVDAKLTVTPPADPAGYLALTGTTPGNLLCMQTHARGPLTELVLASVSEQVVRVCRRPVLLVGPHCDAAPERYDSLVVALDGSTFAESILPTVRAWSTGLRVTPWLFEVLHAYAPFETGKEAVSEAAYVHNVARALEQDGIEAQWDAAHDRHPAHAITAFAAAHQPALLALTTHGSSPVGRAALGSVAFQVAHRATVPVLVLRPEDSTESGG